MAYYGIYRGAVMNTADPLMNGRLQVTVPAIGAAATSWALPCRDFGITATPPIGTAVWVMFEGGDVSSPVWIGCMA